MRIELKTSFLVGMESERETETSPLELEILHVHVLYFPSYIVRVCNSRPRIALEFEAEE